MIENQAAEQQNVIEEQLQIEVTEDPVESPTSGSGTMSLKRIPNRFQSASTS